jgi:ornithine cyclodeaminase/alanine dehydrogenase-like protein (mu-crystallin family)
MSAAIEAVRAAFVQLSAGAAEVPLRVSLPVEPHDGVTLFMPAYLQDGDRMAVKIVSVFNQNPERGLPLIHALVVVVDAATGAPAAVMEGGYLTALRTGAASGVATDLLARPGVRTVTVFGAGAQGRTQLAAVCAVRPIETAWVYDLQPDQARAYSDEMAEQLGIPMRVAETPSEAAREGDVICTATTSSTPVFEDADVSPGTHINAVGAYTPEMQEIPSGTVLRAKVVIDHREASLAEAGDLILPLTQGLMTEDHIHAELGEVAAGHKVGRSTAAEVTVFKSVGVAVQDAAVAGAVLEAARRLDLGTEVEL